MPVRFPGLARGAPLGARLTPGQRKTPSLAKGGVLGKGPGGDLLSHGEAPHYHRRYTVSLLSSGWDQVVPVLHGRQEKGWGVALGHPPLIREIVGGNTSPPRAKRLGVRGSSRTVN